MEENLQQINLPPFPLPRGALAGVALYSLGYLLLKGAFQVLNAVNLADSSGRLFFKQMSISYLGWINFSRGIEVHLTKTRALEKQENLGQQQAIIQK